MTEIVNMARTDATNYKNAGVVRVSDHLYIKFQISSHKTSEAKLKLQH